MLLKDIMEFLAFRVKREWLQNEFVKENPSY